MRDAFPDLRDLPAFVLFSAACVGLFWAVICNDRYRAIVASATFWQIVCAGAVCFLAGALFAHFKLGREDA